MFVNNVLNMVNLHVRFLTSLCTNLMSCLMKSFYQLENSDLVGKSLRIEIPNYKNQINWNVFVWAKNRESTGSVLDSDFNDSKKNHNKFERTN